MKIHIVRLKDSHLIVTLCFVNFLQRIHIPGETLCLRSTWWGSFNLNVSVSLNVLRVVSRHIEIFSTFKVHKTGCRTETKKNVYRREAASAHIQRRIIWSYWSYCNHQIITCNFYFNITHLRNVRWSSEWNLLHHVPWQCTFRFVFISV